MTRPLNLTAANTKVAINPRANPYVASLTINNTAFVEDIWPALTDMGTIIEKNIVNSTVIATLILAGMLFHPKTGSTMKNAEILVSTITKPSSLSIISAIYIQRPIF
jgi:hypothetical protein